MNKRNLFIGVSALCGSYLQGQTLHTQPNIIYILMDDLVTISWITLLVFYIRLLCLMMFTDRLNRSISTAYHTFIWWHQELFLSLRKSLLCQTMELKDIMKERREILSLTQQDLAEMAQVGLATIKDIERGKGNPALNTKPPTNPPCMIWTAALWVP